MAKPTHKEYELSATILSLDKQIRERDSSHQSMRQERDEYLRYAMRLEALLSQIQPEWMALYRENHPE